MNDLIAVMLLTNQQPFSYHGLLHSNELRSSYWFL